MLAHLRAQAASPLRMMTRLLFSFAHDAADQMSRSICML